MSTIGMRGVSEEVVVGGGESGTVVVRVENTSGQTQQVQVHGEGAAASWAVCSPAILELAPGESSLVQVHLTPPVSTPVGSYPVSILATSRHESTPTRFHAAVQVVARGGVTLEVTPPSASGKHATYQVQLHNTSTQPVSLSLHARGLEGGVLARLNEEGSLTLAPGEQVSRTLQVTPATQVTVGNSAPYTIEVQGTPTQGPALLAHASFVYLPTVRPARVPSGVRRLPAAALLLLLLGVFGLSFLGGIRSAGAQNPPASPSAPPSPTLGAGSLVAAASPVSLTTRTPALSPTPAAAPPPVQLDVQGQPGGKAHLTWQTPPGTKVQLNGHDVPARGALLVDAKRTATLVLQARSPQGALTTKTVVVGPAGDAALSPALTPETSAPADLPPPTIDQFTAEQGDQEVTLQWAVSHADTVEVDGRLVKAQDFQALARSLAPGTHAITGTNTMGTAHAELVIPSDGKAAAASPEIAAVQVSNQGDVATVTWRVQGATTVLVQGKPQPASGSITLPKPVPGTTITVVATNAQGTSGTTVVVPAPKTSTPGKVTTPPGQDTNPDWTTLVGNTNAGGTTTNPYLPKIQTFTIRAENPPRLHWVVVGAEQVRVQGQPVAPVAEEPLAKDEVAGTHTIVATNSYGTVALDLVVPPGGGSGTTVPTIPVTPLHHVPTIVVFSIQRQGDAFTLVWDTLDAKTVTINGRGVGTSGSVPLPSPQAGTVLTLVASNTAGSSTATVTVADAGGSTKTNPPVVSVPLVLPQIVVFAQDRGTVRWQVTQADEVLLNGQRVDASGTSAYPAGTRVTLTARNEVGTRERSLEVPGAGATPGQGASTATPTMTATPGGVAQVPVTATSTPTQTVLAITQIPTSTFPPTSTPQSGSGNGSTNGNGTPLSPSPTATPTITLTPIKPPVFNPNPKPDPVADPTKTTGTPNPNPGSTPGTNPGSTPGTTPGTNPNPGTTPGTNPGTTPTPGTPGTNPNPNPPPQPDPTVDGGTQNGTGPGVLTFAPSSVRFPASGAQQSVQVTNTGQGTVVITKVELNGTNATAFSQSGCLGTLTPGKSCTLTLRMNTAAADRGDSTGTYSASVVLTSNTFTSPQSIPLSAGPRTITAGSQVTLATPGDGGSVRGQTTVTNQGPGILNDIRVSIQPATSGMSAQAACQNLDQGNSCTVSVSYVPSGDTLPKANLVLSPQGGSGDLSIPITIGLPSWSVTPNSAQSIPAGDSLTLTVKNQGPGSLVNLNKRLGDESHFSWSSVDGGCGTTLAAGSSCVIGVLFDPQSGGSTLGTTVSVSALGSPSTITVPVSGTFPSWRITPANPGVMGPQDETVLTVENTGSSSLALGNASVSPGDFRLVSSDGGNPCSGQVAAGASCTYRVRFAPVSSGSTFNGTFTLSAIGNPASIAIPLRGIAPSWHISPTSATLGTGETAQFTVTNDGPGSLTLGTRSVSADYAFESTDGGRPCASSGEVLASGESCIVLVSFQPTRAAASISGTLTLNALGNPASLSASLTGTESTFKITPSQLPNDAANPMDVTQSPTKQLTITNTGSHVLTGVTYHLAYPYGISGSSTCGAPDSKFSLSAGSSCVIVFNASNNDSAGTSFTVSALSPSGPFTFYLKSTGVIG